MKKPKKKLNKKSIEILFVSYFFVGLFLAMMVYICRYVYSHEEELINNSYNEGQKLLIAQNVRGSILANDGQILAETKVSSDGKETREYPFGDLFAHTVGYSTNGKTGIEAYMNYNLIQSNAPFNEKVSYNMASQKNPGDNVVTTLDVDIQKAAYQAMGVYDGAIVVTEPKTGKILAMVSKPAFDPNEIEEIWDSLLTDDESGMLLNRAAQGLYPPGSTFKIFDTLEYIKENPDSYNQYRFTCSGSYSNDGAKIKCFHGSSHGGVDLTKSFSKSCNSSFANLSMKLDWDSFDEMLAHLYFRQPLPVEFETAMSTYKRENRTTDDKLQISIGQGETLISPIHLNMITAAIANKGKLHIPYMVERVENCKGALIKNMGSSDTVTLMSEEQSEILTKLMTDVVEHGTATKLKGQLYTAAGKTGSAEYNSQSDSHAWFTGFAPAENPEVCVTVIIEGAGTGGDYAVPMARRCFDAYFSK